ncbi:MAG: hypothetical protein MRERV_54c008, partial [Mycoplasmataceae bacterium RV_VA103A]
LVDKCNSSSGLQSKLDQAEKTANDAQKELEKYRDFVRRLVEKIGTTDLHSEKNGLSILEKGINDWLNDYKEKVETELLTEINALGLGLNEITKKRIFAAISELINKPNPNEALIEELKGKVRTQDLLLADYQNSDNYMSKEMIRDKMQETLKILKMPIPQHHHKMISAQILPEIGNSFEKLLQEETHKREQARNKLITINVILVALTTASLLALVWGLITIRQKNNLLKIGKMKKKRSSRNRLRS